MKKKIFPVDHKVPILLAIVLAVTCWGAALLQSSALGQLLSGRRSVPAFQDTVTLDDAEPIAVPAFKTSQTLELDLADRVSLTPDTAQAFCQSLCSRLDSSFQLLSSHRERGYSDFYCYSPLLEQQLGITPLSQNNANLQVVFTWDKKGGCSHIYLGLPCIDYDF